MLLSKPKRYMSEKLTSVDDEVLYYQEGNIASKINAAYFFLPCGIPNPIGVYLTPVKLGTTSNNGAALFTTGVGFQVDSLDSLSSISDLDTYQTSTSYNVGTLLRNSSSDKAYICHTAYTSGASSTLDDDLDSYWTKIPETSFIKVTCTAPGSGKVVNVNFKIEGY